MTHHIEIKSYNIQNDMAIDSIIKDELYIPGYWVSFINTYIKFVEEHFPDDISNNIKIFNIMYVDFHCHQGECIANDSQKILNSLAKHNIYPFEINNSNENLGSGPKIENHDILIEKYDILQTYAYYLQKFVDYGNKYSKEFFCIKYRVIDNLYTLDRKVIPVIISKLYDSDD